MIIYLHGFRSAPASIKARALKTRMTARGLAERFWCEQLPVSPRAAIALAEGEIARARAAGLDPTVVGSSLGGYYATWLAERHDLRAVLVNPAVVAPLSLEAYVGTQDNLYTGERFEFTHGHIDELRAIVPVRTPLEGYPYILREDMPEPWKTRFWACGSITMSGPGIYAHDWQNFLYRWEKEHRDLAERLQALDDGK